MVSSSTLDRLSEAERRAGQLGLQRTSERLAALRRAMDGFKRLPEDERGGKAHWAMEKLEETRECLVQEMYSNRTEIEGELRSAKAAASMTKGFTFIASLAVYARLMRNMVDGEASVWAISLVSLSVAAAVHCLAWTADKVTGVDRYDELVKSVGKLIDECRAWVSGYGP